MPKTAGSAMNHILPSGPVAIFSKESIFTTSVTVPEGVALAMIPSAGQQNISSNHRLPSGPVMTLDGCVFDEWGVENSTMVLVGTVGVAELEDPAQPPNIKGTSMLKKVPAGFHFTNAFYNKLKSAEENAGHPSGNSR